MRHGVLQSIWVQLAALAGAAGYFVVTTVLMSTLPDSASVACGAASGMLAMVAVFGLPSVSRLRAAGPAGVLPAAAGGVAAFWFAPLLALSQRASDAPPGSEVVFFTTAAWGLFVVLITAFRRPAPLAVKIAGAVLALAGAAILLASWEQPSSFSPFVRFPEREFAMLFAGVVFAVGSALLAQSAGSIGMRSAGLVGAGAATALSLAWAAPAAPEALSAVPSVSGALAALGVSSGVFAASWVWLLAQRDESSAAASLLLVPAGLTALTLLENAVWIHGPNPIVRASAIGGIALSLLGAILLVMPAGDGARPRRVHPWVRPLGALALCVAIASLFTDAVSAEVIGVFGEEYRAAWTMVGAESAVGWLVFAAAAVASAAAWDVKNHTRLAVAAAGASLIAMTTYPLMASTPLRTATRWIPADVQQTYGTEYARLTFEPHLEPFRMLALGLVVLTALFVLVVAVRPRQAGDDLEGAE